MVVLGKYRKLFLGQEDLYTATCILVMILNCKENTLLLKCKCCFPSFPDLKKIEG